MHSIEQWSPEIEISQWIREAGKSLREIEALTGVSRAKLSKFNSGEGNLTVSDLMAIGAAIDKNPREIFGRSVSIAAIDGAYTELGSRLGDALMDSIESRARNAGRTLSIEDVIAWHENTDGHLYRSADIKSHLMAVSPPRTSKEPFKIVDVGERSLASEKVRELGLSVVKPQDVEDFVATSISDRARAMLLKSYVDVHKANGRQYFDRKLFHRSSNGTIILTTYFTLLMAGFWHNGERVIWNFSTEIKSRAASDDEQEEIQGYLDRR